MKKSITKILGLPVVPLDKETARFFVKQLTNLFQQIPLVNYSENDVLAESKGKRLFHARWKHSLIIIEEDRPIAVIVGYERETESTEAYSLNTLYLSELSVAKTHQKREIGGKLLDAFISYNNNLGFVVLPGKLNYTVQTNSAEFNRAVVHLYVSKGFEFIGYKEYTNRKDIVMRYWP